MRFFEQVQHEATQLLLRDAQIYGTRIQLAIRFLRCIVTQPATAEDAWNWAQLALSAADLPDVANYSAAIKREFGVKEAPVLFCINCNDRSFSIPCNGENHFEFAVLYREHGDYRHELLHLFGAKDLYTAPSICTVAAPRFPNSIMLRQGDVSVDPLTAYLVGWQAQPTVEAAEVLSGTAFLSQRQLLEEEQEYRIDGYGVFSFSGGTYCGQFRDKFPHGWGRLNTSDGQCIQGLWYCGVFQHSV